MDQLCGPNYSKREVGAVEQTKIKTWETVDHDARVEVGTQVGHGESGRGEASGRLSEHTISPTGEGDKRPGRPRSCSR